MNMTPTFSETPCLPPYNNDVHSAMQCVPTLLAPIRKQVSRLACQIAKGEMAKQDRTVNTSPCHRWQPLSPSTLHCTTRSTTPFPLQLETRSLMPFKHRLAELKNSILRDQQ